MQHNPIYASADWDYTGSDVEITWIWSVQMKTGAVPTNDCMLINIAGAPVGGWTWAWLGGLVLRVSKTMADPGAGVIDCTRSARIGNLFSNLDVAADLWPLAVIPKS